MTDQDVTIRNGVRALILTPEAEILMMRIRLDTNELIWILPGGGKEAGEDNATGLRRELREELGLLEFEIGPLVWRRRHTFNFFDCRYQQTEEYFVVHTHRFEPVMSDQVEVRVLDCFRWWKIEDLKRAQERLTPLRLAAIVEDYARHGAPTEVPFEVLVD
ncbi:NUDIX domain-containing protein [Devosia sp. YR412]|uniref:NUDIX domain-containing protein n=1 Tax=Devosia sp. YR412 TaxID=1881030 RepID=UPI0008D36AD9|nr:NUDIX domain-containing protein [Devosia sp. YR412]SEP81328.1 NUDIX domain-containing protein [Devosia sp. YR412]